MPVKERAQEKVGLHCVEESAGSRLYLWDGGQEGRRLLPGQEGTGGAAARDRHQLRPHWGTELCTASISGSSSKTPRTKGAMTRDVPTPSGAPCPCPLLSAGA